VKKTIFIMVLSLCVIVVGCQESRLMDKLEEKIPSSGDQTEYDEGSELYSRTVDSELDKKTSGLGGGELSIEEKIIRNAYVSIRSSEVQESYDKTLKLVKKYNGMIVNSSTSKYESSEEAMIEIKVPPKHFLTFLEEVKTIGEIESKNISEEDVTEEYYDIQSRLENKRKVRERLFDLLRKAYKVEEILKVEREIERVGEDIERMEGRLRYLDSKVDYARITVSIYNRSLPLFEKMGIKEGFIKSFQFSIKLFFGIIWLFIILIPLIILVVVLILIILWIVRRKKRRKVQ
jgi:hypothetical protein